MGAEFLIKETDYQSVYTPEQINEEEGKESSTTDEPINTEPMSEN